MMSVLHYFLEILLHSIPGKSSMILTPEINHAIVNKVSAVITETILVDSRSQSLSHVGEKRNSVLKRRKRKMPTAILQNFFTGLSSI